MAASREQPQSPGTASQVAWLAFATVFFGLLAVALSAQFARTCAYLGLYALLPVSAGGTIAFVVPWAYFRGASRDVTARWPMRMLMVYIFALVNGAFYFLRARYRKPGLRSPGLPPLAHLTYVAGLAAVVLTFAVATLIMIAQIILALAPADGLPRLRRLIGSDRRRDDRMSARFRLVAPEGHGKWLRGAMRMGPGSLIWEPAKGVDAVSVELAHATVLPDAAPRHSRRRSTRPSNVVPLETPIGRADLEFSPQLFSAVQELAAAMVGPPADGT